MIFNCYLRLGRFEKSKDIFLLPCFILTILVERYRVEIRRFCRR
ncbi:pentatricopeptide repeat domain-containing protein (PPR motif) [Candidatus Electrothrix aarhusensis]|uniref:Pentatricopeptide repeat domain-containing protein (PPR motif) n=1 Tax=Candidatus Electrothrix aarhusensis TaxID=1859131 RepID=A0A3S3SR47_9BACT|nr:pentatricopeptide repeat domain-containing protein (PPR motif) [Candidatus Electrothrix aarhusensis]